MIVRLAQNGCLLNHLKGKRENPYINIKEKQIPFTITDRVRIARDIASGMLHLSNKKVKLQKLQKQANKGTHVKLSDEFLDEVNPFVSEFLTSKMFLQLVLRDRIILWSQSIQQHVRIDQDCLHWGLILLEADGDFALKYYI